MSGGRPPAPRWALVVRLSPWIVDFGPYHAGAASSFDLVTSDTQLFADTGPLTMRVAQQGHCQADHTQSSSERTLRCLRPEFRTYGDSQVRSQLL